MPLFPELWYNAETVTGVPMVEAERGMALCVQNHQVTPELPLLRPWVRTGWKVRTSICRTGYWKGNLKQDVWHTPTCRTSTWEVRQEAAEFKVIHPWLQTKCKSSLNYARPCLKTRSK